MPTLWELGNELKEIRRLIEEEDGELDDKLEFMLDQVVGGLQDKVSGIGRLMNWCADQKRNAEHIQKQFRRSQEIYENTIKRLEKYVTSELDRAGVETIDDPDGKGSWNVSLTRGETVPRDWGKIPEAYVRIKKELEKTEIRKAIDANLFKPEDVGVEIVKTRKLKFKVHKAVPKPRKKSNAGSSK